VVSHLAHHASPRRQCGPLAIGVPTAPGADRVIQSQLFGTSAGSVGILTMVALGIVSIVFLALESATLRLTDSSANFFTDADRVS
jgi:hypothetical protein